MYYNKRVDIRQRERESRERFPQVYEVKGSSISSKFMLHVTII